MFASRMILPYLLRRRQQNCCAIAHCEKTERCSAHRLVQGLFSRLAAIGCERYGRDGRSMTWCTAEIMVEVKPSGERAYRHSPRTQMAPTDPLEPRDAPTHLPCSLASHNAPRCPTCSVIMRVRLLVPGEHEEQVTYHCDKCRAEVIRGDVRRGPTDV